MLDKVSERTMHLVRWLLTISWLVLIFSLFYDPISAYLTKPHTTWSPLRLDPKLFDPKLCHQVLEVQGKCLEEQPYPLGAEIFWGMVIPSAIMILLVFGHEFWRRICPLSFLSQIPRALGIQRQHKVVNLHTGTVRYELAKVKSNSWLGRNHLYLQFGLLCLGLTIRILFINSNRILLGSFLILTIICAICVGYLYGGKTWCQYFCPMAPVQIVFTGNRGLLGSEAHQGEKKIITQSMCRTVDQKGQEKSVCVGCKSPCIDIDAERSYWEILNQPSRKLVQYGYVGLVIGFYVYFLLYSGTLNYYYSGAWTHEENQLATLVNPGFYINGKEIPIPKLIAVPLTIIFFVTLSYFLFNKIEKLYKAYLHKKKKSISQELVQHRIFSICTFVAFNAYFVFGGRPILKLLPFPLELGFNVLVVLVSTLWLYRTLGRSHEDYFRESLANSLRRQLSKLNIDFSRFLEGRSLEEMKVDEVYVLAKVLPSFSKESSWQVYRGMLREALEQGSTNPANSLEVLKSMRLELGLKEEEHFTILSELGLENPDLLDSSKHRSRENQLRLESYRQALEQQLLDLLEMGIPLREALQRKNKQIQALKQEYGITAEEEEQLLTHLADENSVILRKAEGLLTQLKELVIREQVLSNLVPKPQAPIFVLLRSVAIGPKQQFVINQLLGILEILEDVPEARRIASAMGVLAEKVLPNLLPGTDETLPWQEQLNAEVFALLQPPESTSMELSPTELEVPDGEAPTVLRFSGPTPVVAATNRLESVIEVLKELLQELDPLVQAAALYALEQLDSQQGCEQARQLMRSAKPGDWLVRETAEKILAKEQKQTPVMTPTLIAQITTLDGETEERIFQQPVVRVGRSLMNEIVLSDQKVVEQHAIFYLDEQGVSVMPLRTAYGLRIGNQQVKSERRLNQGDVILFSRAEIPTITVRWKKQMQSEPLTEILKTLDKVLLLFETGLLRFVKPNALVKLARDAVLRVYPQGAILCKEGDPSDEILLLVDGEADVTIHRGEAKVVNVVRAGETIGEIGILTRQKRSATVVTTAEKNRVLAINAKNFESVVYRDSELARNLVLMLSTRLQRLTAKVQS